MSYFMGQTRGRAKLAISYDGIDGALDTISVQMFFDGDECLTLMIDKRRH